MKIRLFVILVFIAILNYSCKVQERVVEKVEYKVDSTEVVHLRGELVQLQTQVVQYSEQLKESRLENERLQSTANFSVKEFDTDKPNAPLKKETHYNQSKSTEKQVIVDRTLEISLKSEIELLTSKIAVLEKKLEFAENYNSQLESTKKTKSVFQWWLLIIGFVVGAVVYHYAGFALRLIIKK